MAKTDKKADAKKKDSKKKGGKKGSGESAPYSSIATHPRAKRQVQTAKGWGGLIGFTAAMALSLMASVPFAQAGLRALVFGFLGYLLGWGLSLVVWRQWMIAEQRAAIAEIKRRRQELEDQQNQARPKKPSQRAPAGA